MTTPPLPDKTPGGSLLVEITGAGADPRLVGGKGAWLDRLVASGFAVPPTAVLSTAAYRLVAALEPVSALVERCVAEPLPSPAEHDRERRAVDEAFLAVELPASVSDAIGAIDATVRGERGLVAARSSATAEDLHGTSFAGQYRSLLQLGDPEELERAVRLVWASLWHPAPRSYRRYHGINESDLTMAVIVMRQVPARTAGVAFTVDPGGTPDTVRVEAVTGLGEQLVSGAVTPTVHLVPRGSTPGAATEPSIDPVIAQAANLALAVERAFGEPQDIEWAEDDEGLWLLQARPITTGTPSADDDGFDTPDAASRRWTTSGIVEMLPGVLPPLRWAVGHLLLEEALRHNEAMLDLLPVDELDGRALLGRVRGRAALDADLRAHTERAAASSRGRLAALRRSVVALRARRRAMWEAGTVTVAAVELDDLAPDLTSLDESSLLAHRRRIIDLAGRTMAAEVAVASAAVSATRRLETLLGEHLEPDEAMAWTQRLTARPAGTVAGWPTQAITDTLRRAPHTAVQALAAADTWAEACSASDPGARALVSAIERQLRSAGSAAVPGGPTWEEAPERWWPALRDLATRADEGTLAAPPDPAAPGPLDDLLDGLAANADWRLARLATAQVIDVRRSRLRRAAEEAADLLERRERTKAAVLSIGGHLRRVHLELGRRLVSAGHLGSADEIELLGEGELLRSFRRGGRPAVSPPPAELARRRRWLARCELDGPLPERFDGRPGPTRAAEPGTATATGNEVLRGWGASPGHASGRARVLETAASGELDRGDILVARSTDASWVPLFLIAGGVVVEQGGPLSHAAIIARELGIPAVVNLPGVVSRLGSAPTLLTVDGDDGTVTIVAVDEHHSGAEVPP